jgi:hypothetical protein
MSLYVFNKPFGGDSPDGIPKKLRETASKLDISR